MKLKKQKPLISILMAAYNSEKTIRYAIDSVLVQTFHDWELLIIDDCSADNTLNVAESYKDTRIRILKNDRNCGVSLTRKKGLDAAEGDWIAVLDSDDMWAPDKLEKQIALVRLTDAALVFTGSAFIKADGMPIDWQLHVPDRLNYHELLKQNLISNSSVLVKTDLYRKNYAIGDEIHEDFAIWIGITQEGKLAYGIDEPLLIYRISQSSKSGDKIKSAKMNWNTYRYVGIPPAKAAYYMCWYIVNGLLKYRHLKLHAF